MFFRYFLISFVCNPGLLKLIYRNTNININNSVLEDLPNNNENKIKEYEESLKDILEKNKNKSDKFFRTGIDYRKNETNYNEIIFDIRTNLLKMDLLKKLESTKIGSLEKLEAIKKYNKDTNENTYLINLKSGKLMDDWIRGTDGSP
uniref:Uncharacterized protein n=1 Tax=viral metagenome TaxID=1070528 RepID=A0A6C0HTN0_9ZZZZ